MSTDPFQAIRLKEANLREMLDSLPDIDIVDQDGRNLLHEAIAWKNVEAGLELIARGINVNARDKDGFTPLHFASIHQNAAIARAILSNGGDPSITNRHGNTPLWDAVQNARGNYETVRVFAEFGCAEIARQKNRYGRSPLDFANQIGDATLAAIISSDS
jgi:uncharacterized protein